MIKNENTGFRTIQLEPNTPVMVNLESSHSQFCEVPCKGLQSPMSISIARLKGAPVRTYIYKRFPEVYEISTSDSVVITDSSYHFKTDKFYIKFSATEDCLFQVIVRFGKFYKRLNRENTSKEKLNVYIEEDSLDRKIKREKKVFSCNFVQINKSVQKRSCRTIIRDRTARTKNARQENTIKSMNKTVSRPILMNIKKHIEKKYLTTSCIRLISLMKIVDILYTKIKQDNDSLL